MARTSNRRQREAARLRAQEAAAAREASARRRRRWLAGAAGAVVVLGVVAAAFGARSGSSRTSSPSTTAAPLATSSSQLPAGGVAPTAAPMGAALTGATPCPAEDGSSPRTTLFAEAPPTCIDPGYFYIATVTTSVGRMTVQLNPKLAPRTVNDFVVLARYHFYDGQPVTSVTSRQSFTIGLAFSGEGADRAPGFTFPGDASAQGTVVTPGTFVTGGTASGEGAARGQLTVATFEDAAGIDPTATTFGFMLSGDDVLRAIDALATQDGQPTQAVTVDSISVVRSSPIPT